MRGHVVLYYQQNLGGKWKDFESCLCFIACSKIKTEAHKVFIVFKVLNEKWIQPKCFHLSFCE